MDNTQALVGRESPQLPEAVSRRGITEAQWRTLANNLFPGAAAQSVLMVWDYCAARNLDPMKKPCHIVPMEVKNAQTGSYEWRDVVMPGIYEYRITAHRTGDYLGHSEPEYGPDKMQFGVMAPEWCKVTVFRWNQNAHEKVPFPVTVYFTEVIGTRKDRDSGGLVANARWNRAPRQMLAKCTEAAGLREAFPEEIGGEPTAEEMDGQRAPAIDATVIASAPAPSKAMTTFEQLPEGLRDRIEKGFAILNFSSGQRITKVNEYFGGTDPAEDQATMLLEWLQDEFARRKTGQPVQRKRGRPKKETADAPPVQTATVKTVAPAAPSADPPVPQSHAPVETPSGEQLF